MLKVDNIRFGYSGRAVVDGVSFSASAHDALAIMGPNGSGKTTLLKCLNGILKPDHGSVRLDGMEVSSMDRMDIARKAGYVSQKASASGMTVFDFVLLGRLPHIGWDVMPSDIDLVSSIIQGLGLEEIAMRRTDEVSGGELQIAQVARALAQQPGIILLDEPTSSLDICNQHRLMELVSDLVSRNPVAAVVTIHDIGLAARYCNKFILMKEGRIYACGGSEVITAENIREVYGMDAIVENVRGIPVVIPL